MTDAAIVGVDIGGTKVSRGAAMDWL